MFRRLSSSFALQIRAPATLSPHRTPDAGCLKSTWTKAKRIILIRHGESEGNVNENAYVTTPDWRIGITARGQEQSREAGRQLAALVKDEPVMFYVSP